jgi:hypothetical protein
MGTHKLLTRCAEPERNSDSSSVSTDLGKHAQSAAQPSVNTLGKRRFKAQRRVPTSGKQALAGRCRVKQVADVVRRAVEGPRSSRQWPQVPLRTGWWAWHGS